MPVYDYVSDGTTSLAGADASGDDTDCTPVICEENQYVLSFECEPCADGSYNATGDDASQGNTTCDTIMCSSNVDPLRYPDHECGDYGILRSDFA